MCIGGERKRKKKMCINESKAKQKYPKKNHEKRSTEVQKIKKNQNTRNRKEAI